MYHDPLDKPNRSIYPHSPLNGKTIMKLTARSKRPILMSLCGMSYFGVLREEKGP